MEHPDDTDVRLPECPACGRTDYDGPLRECPHCGGDKCSFCDMGDDVGCPVCDTEDESEDE